MRGRLGASRAEHAANEHQSLQVALENVTSSESTISDTDFLPAETSQFDAQPDPGAGGDERAGTGEHDAADGVGICLK